MIQANYTNRALAQSQKPKKATMSGAQEPKPDGPLERFVSGGLAGLKQFPTFTKAALKTGVNVWRADHPRLGASKVLLQVLAIQSATRVFAVGMVFGPLAAGLWGATQALDKPDKESAVEAVEQKAQQWTTAAEQSRVQASKSRDIDNKKMDDRGRLVPKTWNQKTPDTITILDVIISPVESFNQVKQDFQSW